MKPNIVVYFTDQQRADTCGCYGQKLDITPNLDRLAQEGVKFENAFTAQPVCGPCRALFQTGKWPTDLGCFRNNLLMRPGVKHLATYLEENGYETAYVGKWHLASHGELESTPVIDNRITPVPRELRGGYTGFWRVTDMLELTTHSYSGYVFDENDNRVELKGYRTDAMTDMALEFLDERQEKKPFFMMLSYIEPHHEERHLDEPNYPNHKRYEGPAGSREKYQDFESPEDLRVLGGNHREEYPDYLGMCASLDENLGRLVSKLKEKGLYDNTVIIFVSDHGSHFYTRNRDEHLNGFDDYKRSVHDACLKVPFVIAGGPFKGGQNVEDIVSTSSLPKTICALAGIDVGDDMIGENLIHVVEGKLPDRRNEAFAQISESRVGRCIRTPEYAYAVYAPGVHGGEAGAADLYADDFLYDLKKDPYEFNNLIGDPAYTEVKLELRKRLLTWIKEAEDAEPEIVD